MKSEPHRVYNSMRLKKTRSLPGQCPGPPSSISPFSQSNDKYAATLPPSALRKGKYDASGQNQPSRPSLDLGLVYEVYGDGASLYRILHVKPSAEKTEIRKAYLNQGRKTLLDHGIARKNDRGGCSFVANDAPRKLDDVPEEARKKFRAISIAYEILSNQGLRKEYDCCGELQSQPLNDTVMFRRTRSGNNVRWKPFVEEKIIRDAHPDEHSHRRGSITDQENEDGWLESHLHMFDQEAKMFFSGDMLDELDGSVTSFQESVESLMKRVGSHEKVQGVTALSSAEVKATKGTSREAAHIIGGNKQMSTSINNPKKQKHPSGSVPKRRCEESQADVFGCSKQHYGEKNSPNPSESMIFDVEGVISGFLDSPCSVINVGQIGGLMGGMTTNLSKSFYELFDGPEDIDARESKDEISVSSAQRKISNQHMGGGFREPAYSLSEKPSKTFRKRV